MHTKVVNAGMIIGAKGQQTGQAHVQGARRNRAIFAREKSRAMA